VGGQTLKPLSEAVAWVGFTHYVDIFNGVREGFAVVSSLFTIILNFNGVHELGYRLGW